MCHVLNLIFFLLANKWKQMNLLMYEMNSTILAEGLAFSVIRIDFMISMIKLTQVIMKFTTKIWSMQQFPHHLNGLQVPLKK